LGVKKKAISLIGLFSTAFIKEGVRNNWCKKRETQPGQKNWKNLPRRRRRDRRSTADVGTRLASQEFKKQATKKGGNLGVLHQSRKH